MMFVLPKLYNVCMCVIHLQPLLLPKYSYIVIFMDVVIINLYVYIYLCVNVFSITSIKLFYFFIFLFLVLSKTDRNTLYKNKLDYISVTIKITLLVSKYAI